MSNNFDPNKRLDDVKRSGDKILSNYTSGIDEAISENEEMQEEVLDQIGIDDKGNVIEGSVTDKLMDVQKENTDFAIDTIEQQKKNAKSDYTKEQAGAYADYQKQINPYGVQAEQVASQGLDNSGYADSLKTQAYVAYQNRVAVARESYNRIVQDFNNQITQARLQNNSTLAEIYTQAMAQRLQYIVEFRIRGDELLITKTQGAANIEQQNLSNYQAVYNQLMEQQQFESQMAFQREQFEYQKQQNALKTATAKSRSSGGSSSRSSKKSSSGKKAITKRVTKDNDTAIKSKKTSSKSQPTVDMESVLNLGYGPISAAKLNQLVSQGRVEEYVKNGKLKYRKVFKR